MVLWSQLTGVRKCVRPFVQRNILAVMLLAGAFTVIAANILQANTTHAADHLVARWKFDETTAGVNAKDYIGSNDGVPGTQTMTYPTPSTDVAPVEFENPRSAEFNGQNYFTINNPVSADFTICAWAKTSSTGGGTAHWTSAPIMDAEWGGVNYDFGFGVGNGGKLMFGNGGNPVGGGGIYDQQVNGSTTINDNQWHNVCVTRNNTTGAVKLYVDAQLDGQGTTGIGALTVRSVARIGWGYDGAALFHGLIDDVRVYDTDLASEQLQALTNGIDDPFDDNDGIAADIEDAAPGSDGNGDGTPDSQQANVASFVNPLTNRYTTLAVSSQCHLSGVSSVNAATIAGDSSYSYPLGLLNFTTNCGTPRYTMVVKQIYYDPPAGNFIFRKYIDGKYQTIDSATIVRTTLNNQNVIIVEYSVTDGGSLDADGLENGIIVDPAGLAIAGATEVMVPGAPNAGFTRQNSLNLWLVVSAAVVLLATMKYVRSRA